MRFRPHRGSFFDSIEEMFQFDGTKADLEARCGVSPITVERYGSRVDDREPWNAETWIVCGPDGYPIGFTDGAVE